MSEVTFTRCDGCKVAVESPSDKPGWIQIAGTSVETRRYSGKRTEENVPEVAAIRGRDYCSVYCLLEQLDAKCKPQDPKCMRHADCRANEKLARECYAKGWTPGD